MIRFENVSKTYDGKRYVLNDLNIEIADGEFVFVMGPSGAGKTTFTKLLLREEKVTEGRIYLNKYKIHKLPDRKVPQLRRSMGFVFQDFRLFQNKTVYENVAFAMEVLGEPSKLIKKRVPVALDIVGLTGKEKVMPKELSGGEKQRLCVARAIVNSPSVVVADEPTGNLDFKLAKEIMDLLVKIAEYGKTVIVVTHAKELVEQYDKRVITIDEGCVVSDTKAGTFANVASESSQTEAATEIFPTACEEEISTETDEAKFTDEMTSSEISSVDDENISGEGENLFNSIIDSFSVNNGSETDTLAEDFSFDATDNSTKFPNDGTKDDTSSSNRVEEMSYSELSEAQGLLAKEKCELQNKITEILAKGDDNDSADATIDELRASLDRISAEIDTLDNQMGKFGDISFESSENADGGDANEKI